MKMRKLMALLLVLATVFAMSACGGETKTTVNGNALLQVVLQEVVFDTPIADVGEDAALYFSGMPAGAAVKMYTGSGYYADRVALITLAGESDAQAAKDSVQEHVEQLRNQFANYIPEEVPKVENAVIWSQGNYVLLCVTADYQNAQDIVDNAQKWTQDVTVTQGTEATTQATTEPTEATTEATTQPTEPETVEYPSITSKSGTYKKMGGSYVVDDAAYENYKYDENSVTNYTGILNKVAQQLDDSINFYFLPIPTAIGIVLPDDIAPIMGDDYQDQHQRMGLIFDKLDDSIKTVDCFDNLMKHRDEYLYFRTDYHWNGKAAYYAYEIWCKEKGETPYTLDQRKLSTFDGFWGGLYSGDCKKDPALRGDTVEAYHPYGENISMVFTDRKGNEVPWNIIYDVSSWNAGLKYNTFAGGDNPITVYKNPNVTDGSVGVVVKDSFGNALMPYMVDHYSTLYELDYRYWEGNLADFCKEVGAKDLTIANNMGMIRAAVLVAYLANKV